MESRDHIEDTAAAFIAKRGTGDWTDVDEAEFVTWLAAAVSHRAVYYRLNAAWEEAGRLQALRAGDAHSTPAITASRTDATDQISRASRAWRYALAASVLLAIGVGWFVWPAGPAYRTEVGGLAAVPLADGSKVTLNTDSKIRVAVSETERRIHLERGEAYFEVAKDPGRPFIVQAGNKRVIAIGTKFSVRHDSDDTRVVVTEGRVRVESTAGEVAAIELDAGSIARAWDDGLLVERDRAPEIERTLTWRSGQLTFRDTPLAEAVAEFNRYNTRKIVIEDPAIAALEVGGVFRATNVEPFVRLLEEAFPLEATEADGSITLAAVR